MESGLPFKRLTEIGSAPIKLDFEGRPIPARTGDTIAAALLAAGIVDFRRTSVSGTLRGPYCMMGACFDCLVQIDGVANRQACITVARDGMQVRFMDGARAPAQAEHDD